MYLKIAILTRSSVVVKLEGIPIIKMQTTTDTNTNGTLKCLGFFFQVLTKSFCSPSYGFFFLSLHDVGCGLYLDPWLQRKMDR